MKTGGNWSGNRRNQGGTTVETWVELNWELEQKKRKLEWRQVETGVETEVD